MQHHKVSRTQFKKENNNSEFAFIMKKLKQWEKVQLAFIISKSLLNHNDMPYDESITKVNYIKFKDDLNFFNQMELLNYIIV